MNNSKLKITGMYAPHNPNNLMIFFILFCIQLDNHRNQLIQVNIILVSHLFFFLDVL